jgi:uncharacterized membrane protein YdfJ with MMPL/SSD domain
VDSSTRAHAQGGRGGGRYWRCRSRSHQPVFRFAVAAALATDYGVFLLARITARRDRREALLLDGDRASSPPD